MNLTKPIHTLDFEALILDVDGTLWDTSKIVCESWNRAIADAGYEPCFTEESIGREFGLTMAKIAEDVIQLTCGRPFDPLNPSDRELIENCFSYEDEAIITAVPDVYEGVVSTLSFLAQHMKLYIVSNCQKGYIEAFMEKTGTCDLFSGHLCFGDTGTDKGTTIRLLMEKYGVKNAAYVGDIEGDALAAQAAGIPFIWASYGFGHVPAERCFLTIRHFGDLAELLPLKSYLDDQAYRTYCIVTFGCQMNARDSEKLSGILSRAGLAECEKEEEADIVVFNTCTIRENANEHLYGRLGRLKQVKAAFPHRIIALCGCMMQETDEVETIRKKYPYTDLIFGTHNFHLFGALLKKLLLKRQGILRSVQDVPEGIELISDSDQDMDKMRRLLSCGSKKNLKEAEKLKSRPVVSVWKESPYIVENIPSKRKYPFKQGVNIMYGCNNFCSYCIVPYVRGREKSREKEDILREIRLLGQEGVREIMLLGQNVNSYGKTLSDPVSFADLLTEIDESELGSIERIRFMTSHPKDLSPELITAIRDGRHIMHQFHLPLQSGSDVILKRMNRHYDQAAYLEKAALLRREIPDISISTDIIVGFPGETEEDFEETLKVVEEVRFDAAYTFVYSRRQGTPAFSMPDQVSAEAVRSRFDRLTKALARISDENCRKMTGKILPVLFEEEDKEDSGILTGRLYNNMAVHVKGDPSLTGKIAHVELTGAHGFYFSGRLLP